MRREGKPDWWREVFRDYPVIFWYKCANCKEEVRREWLWRANIHPRAWTYLCCECAPTEVEAQELFKTLPWIRRPQGPPPMADGYSFRPPPPPSPPPVRVIREGISIREREIE